MGNFKNKTKLTVLEGGISKTKAPADWVSGGDPLLAAGDVVWAGPHGAEGGKPTHFNGFLNNHD